MTTAEVLEGVITAMRRQTEAADGHAEQIEQLQDDLASALGRLAALEARVEAGEA